MPSVWSWYQIVEARLSLGYWKVAKPEPQVAPYAPLAFFLKKSYHVPLVAYPAGMFDAAGKYHASA
jgi:hypothetical protein